jgi:putrescine transport system permease protein
VAALPAERAPRALRRRRGLVWLLAAPLAWLLVFLALPVAIVLSISLSRQTLAMPPYTPLLAWDAEDGLRVDLTLEHYAFLVEDPFYLEALLGSLGMAASTTLICLLIAFPMAHAMATAPARWRAVMLLLVVLPFWTSFLLRVYAWTGLLAGRGPINQILLGLGLIDAPLALMNSNLAVQVGLVYTYLPFMVLPLYAALDRFDASLLEAAADLGATPWTAFRTVTLPMVWPGVLAGSALVFLPVTGEFVIPDLLGGADTLMLGKVLWEEFFANRAWPQAAAVAVCMLLLVALPGLLKAAWRSLGPADRPQAAAAGGGH